ncbi:hypothetical protein P9112_008974 [Eukaryota sp. TZLM1-RC]
MSEISQQDISNSNSSRNMQQQEPATHIQIHNKEGNEVTDPDPTSPSPKVKDERADEVPSSSIIKEVTRTDLAPSPPPNVEPVGKVTDKNPTLNKSTPLAEYDEFYAQLDDKGKMIPVMDSTNSSQERGALSRINGLVYIRAAPSFMEPNTKKSTTYEVTRKDSTSTIIVL